jgi:hypothetical protein
MEASVLEQKQAQSEPERVSPLAGDASSTMSLAVKARADCLSTIEKYAFLSQAAHIVMALVFILITMNVTADAQSTRPAAQPAQPAAPSAPSAAAPVPMIDKALTLILVRSTLLALQQANETGNYSVMRELGAPEFQNNNSSSRLSENFANLRAQKIDLSPLTVLEPELSLPLKFENNILKIKGFFPSAPLQVNFDLAFTNVANRWRLMGLSLDMSPNAQSAQQGNPAATGGVSQRNQQR